VDGFVVASGFYYGLVLFPLDWIQLIWHWIWKGVTGIALGRDGWHWIMSCMLAFGLEIGREGLGPRMGLPLSFPLGFLLFVRFTLLGFLLSEISFVYSGQMIFCFVILFYLGFIFWISVDFSCGFNLESILK